jgi:signal transduction histidine kinase
VLLEGTIAVSQRVGSDDVETKRTSSRGVYAGAFHAYLGDRISHQYTSSMRAIEPSRFFLPPAESFAAAVNDWFQMAVHLLEGLFFGTKNIQEAVGQRERLLALGTLSAGLTHELNNPAAAAVSATSALRGRVAGMRRKLGAIAAGVYERGSLETLIAIQDRAAEQVAKAAPLSPMEAADREDALGDWFDEHDVADGWDLAPTFVQAGVDIAWLDRVAEAVDASALEGAIQWLHCTVEIELLMNEIADSTVRISSLVNATKQYSQLDRAPYQVVDVHDLLDSTLLMLTDKIGSRIAVVKDYDRTLPRIPAYPSELNQVWTNLIDNAIAAMKDAGGEGTLTVRTALDRDRLLVEFRDTGPGVPPEIRKRIFDPFFTTKPVGEGTGLGLDICWRIVVSRHGGDLRLESAPGDTRFQVYLPLTASVPDEPQEAS